MKSLAQIEPPTPISSALFTITIPDSYYLAISFFPKPSSNKCGHLKKGVVLSVGVLASVSGMAAS
jgi:hypothetical protein